MARDDPTHALHTTIIDLDIHDPFPFLLEFFANVSCTTWFILLLFFSELVVSYYLQLTWWQDTYFKEVSKRDVRIVDVGRVPATHLERCIPEFWEDSTQLTTRAQVQDVVSRLKVVQVHIIGMIK